MLRVGMSQILVDYTGSEVETTRWRTFMVLAHTMSGSGRIAGRAVLRRLKPSDVERTVKRWWVRSDSLANHRIRGRPG